MTEKQQYDPSELDDDFSDFLKSDNPKKKPYLAIIIGGVILALIVGGGFLFRNHQKNNAVKQFQETGETFVSYIEKKDFSKMGKLLSSDSLSDNSYTEESVVEKYTTIFDGLNLSNIKSSDIKTEQISDNLYRLTYKLSMTTPLGDLENLEYSTTILKSGDTYKINWEPELIFPDMDATDKVILSSVEPTRGRILDANGTELALEKEFDQLSIIPGELGDDDATRNANIQLISQTYGVSVDTIESLLAQEWVQDDQYVPILTLTDQAYTSIQGTTLGTVTQRYYPLKEAAAHLIGYTGSATASDIEKDDTLSSNSIIGRAGIEATCDKELRGLEGGSIDIVTKNGQNKSTLISTEKTDGSDITLTIDSATQQKAFDSLGGLKGATVVSNPSDGSITALVSSPSFDPNKMALGISQEDYDVYNNDENKPFLDRFASRYAPGSTFKTVTAAIAIDAGTLDPNAVRTINGTKWQKSDAWGDYYVTRLSDVSSVNLETALVYSDNIYFAQTTLDLGEEKFRNGLSKFIFGEKLDIPINMKAAQISNNDAFDSEILLADTGYGQGELLISPIEQMAFYSVFMNQGTLVYPKLIQSAETKTKADVISQNAADIIKQDLIQVVANSNGTANSLYNASYPLAAKTGTAEIKETQDSSGVNNSFIFTFDPTANKFAVMSMIEDYQNKEQAAVAMAKPLVEYLEQK